MLAKRYMHEIRAKGNLTVKLYEGWQKRVKYLTRVPYAIFRRRVSVLYSLEKKRIKKTGSKLIKYRAVYPNKSNALADAPV